MGPDTAPELESVVGVWPVDLNGVTGKFRANPDYLPTDAEAPSDPIDAALRAMADDRDDGARLALLLRDSLVDLAMNGDGRPLVVDSPDDELCVVITTSEPHRGRVSSPRWRRVSADVLLEMLTEVEEVLVNPGGAASVRLTAEFLRQAVAMTDEEAEAELARLGGEDGQFPLLHWNFDGLTEEEGPGASVAGTAPAEPPDARPADHDAPAAPPEEEAASRRERLRPGRRARP
jgi:hypothetical protein